jgi:hypothetical protein
MTVLAGHFDGRCVILDGPIPRGMKPNTRVKVMVPSAGRKKGASDLPSLATLKSRLKAGSGASLTKAQANARELIGRASI